MTFPGNFKNIFVLASELSNVCDRARRDLVCGFLVLCLQIAIKLVLRDLNNRPQLPYLKKNIFIWSA